MRDKDRLMKITNFIIVVFIVAGCTSEPQLPVIKTYTDTPALPPNPSPTPTLEPRINATTSGEIKKDEIWRDEIHITGDISIMNNATLTIEPGTKVYISSNIDDRYANDTTGCFDSYTCLHNDPTIKVGWGAKAISIVGNGGTIIAIGTEDKRIEFLPEGSKTSPAQWQGIIISRGTIQYSVIKYAGHGAIIVTGKDIEIANNIIIFPFWVGIDVFAPKGWIHNNTIYGGGHQAIGIKSSSALVEQNFISNCNTGIFTEYASESQVTNNIVVDCGTGIETIGSKNSILNNTIASIKGVPDGWYYQGRIIYPSEESSAGIIASGLDYTIQNNIIYGPIDNAIVLPNDFDASVVVSNNLAFRVKNTIVADDVSIGKDTIYGDPSFVDVQGYNFRLLPGSLAIDKGSPDILDTDGSISDLGAFGGSGGYWQAEPNIEYQWLE